MKVWGDRMRMAVVVVWLGCLGGCSSSVAERKIDPTVEHLQAIGQAYGQALARGKTPRKIADLQPFLKESGKQADDVARSPRDGEPFVILWGTRLQEPEPRLFAYEKDGKDGSRHVLMTDGSTRLLSDEEFQKTPKVK